MKNLIKHLKLDRSDTNKVLQLPYHAILSIKPDPEWNQRSHIKTTFKDKYNKPIWFHVKHNYGEVLDMYYEVKKNVGGR